MGLPRHGNPARILQNLPGAEIYSCRHRRGWALDGNPIVRDRTILAPNHLFVQAPRDSPAAVPLKFRHGDQRFVEGLQRALTQLLPLSGRYREDQDKRQAISKTRVRHSKIPRGNSRYDRAVEERLVYPVFPCHSLRSALS